MGVRMTDDFEKVGGGVYKLSKKVVKRLKANQKQKSKRKTRTYSRTNRGGKRSYLFGMDEGVVD